MRCWFFRTVPPFGGCFKCFKDCLQKLPFLASLSLSVSIMAFLLFTSCSPSHSMRRTRVEEWRKDNDKIKILSTTGMIHDLVSTLGGDFVDSLILIQGELDPHTYQLVKGDDENVLFAQIIFYNGLGLEHGPSLRRHLIHHPNAIGLGDKIEGLDPGAIIHVNGEKDPHIWMDIILWSQAVPLIAEAMSRQDPAHASFFWQQAQKLQREMEETHLKVRQLIQDLPASLCFLVSSHDAFNYFARAYLARAEERAGEGWRSRVAAPEGLAPESQLSVTNIRMILDYIKKHKVAILFPEVNVNQDSLKKILQAGNYEGLRLSISSKPLYGDSMGPLGSSGETYLGMMLYNAFTFSEEVKSTPWIKS